MSKIYIYHHNDHDGIIAAGVLYNHLSERRKQQVIFNMIDYNVELNFDHINFGNCDEVYFLDYSFSSKHNQEEFKKLLERRIDGDDVVWIDHHKTSIGLFDDYNITGIRNTALCGAAWTYLWCNDLMNSYYNLSKEEASNKFHDCEGGIPVFLKYIDDYDCWKKMYMATNDFHYGLILSDPRDLIIERLLDKNIDGAFLYMEYQVIIEQGKQIQAYLNFENKEYHIDMYGFEYTLPEEHGGLKCFCLNRKGNSIMFGDKIKEYDVVIPFYYNNGKWTYSIYSIKEDIDCSEVAKTYGGGGHKGAAGFTISEFIFK